VIRLATSPLVEYWRKIIESFPSELSETNWWDWLWFTAFIFLGSPLVLEIWKAEKKGRKEVIGIFVLIVTFFGGWSLVGYFTR
jgi:hypothetical protein